MSELQDKEDISDLKDTFLECPVCEQHFNQTDRRPRLLHSCLHAFCTQCLHQLLIKEAKGQITCPLCCHVQKVPGTADTLPVDPVRSKLVEYTEMKHKKKVCCTHCPGNNMAKGKCEECHIYLCKDCILAHRRHHQSRDHTIVTVEEVLKQPKKEFSCGHFCFRHPNNLVEYYCNTDEHLCCSSCTILDHKGHAFEKLEIAAKKRQREIEETLNYVYMTRNHLRQSQEQARTKETAIRNGQKQATLDINNIIDYMREQLDQRRHWLLSEVAEKSSILLSSVQKTSAANDRTLAIIESTDTYFTQAKEKTGVVEILQMYPAIKKSLSLIHDQPVAQNVQTNVPMFRCLPSLVNTFEDILGDLGMVYEQGCQISELEAHGFQEDVKGTRREKLCLDNMLSRKELPSFTVTQMHLEAMTYILGEEEIERCCKIEDVNDFQKKIYLVGPRSETVVLQERVQGIVQEELNLKEEQQSISKDQATGAAAAVMKDNRDAYIKYLEDKHSLIIFGEDWAKIAKAKKRVQLQFGQGKSSRGRRRFAGTDKIQEVEKGDSKNDDKMSFIRQSGSAIAEGRHIVVKVYQTDITKLKLDAIVNAANGNLNHGGGVARAISSAGGVKLDQHSKQIVKTWGPVHVTRLAVTQPGKLPCQMVFHAVGPEWRNYTDKNQCLEDLCRTILRCLCEALNRNIASIAIPPISSSIFGVPQELCAQMYVRALKSFDSVVTEGTLKDVHLVDVSDKMVGIIVKELEQKWMKPQEDTILARDMAFIERNTRYAQ